MLNTVAGLIKSESGHIIFNGKDVTGWLPHRVYHEGICRTFQIPAPFRTMTVLENILCAKQVESGESFWFSAFGRRWHKTERDYEESASKILQLTGLETKRDAVTSTLSGGQLKLLEFSRALMGGGKILLLDEPVAGVLPSLALEILTHMRRTVVETGITLLMIEHRLDIALKFADYVYALNNGKVIASGKPDEITKDEKVIEAYLGG